MIDQAEILENHAESPSEEGDLALGQVRHIGAVYQNTPPVGDLGPVEELEQRRLSASGGANENCGAPIWNY